MFATWGRCDGLQWAVFTALRHPHATRDPGAALGAAGLAFSPQLLDDPDFETMLEPMVPTFPQTEEQMQVTTEQRDADLAHDTLDRLGAITAPTLVVVGEQDLLTPPWQSKASPTPSRERATGSSPAPGPATGCTSNGPTTCCGSSPGSCATPRWGADRHARVALS
jgi:pimeloyl-ACP methyl ester carboxylesterase